jgi:hypothetical protein
VTSENGGRHQEDRTGVVGAGHALGGGGGGDVEMGDTPDGVFDSGRGGGGGGGVRIGESAALGTVGEGGGDGGSGEGGGGMEVEDTEKAFLPTSVP